MTMERAPRLDDPVTIMVTATTVLDAPNTSVNLALPDSATLVSGTGSYQGDLKPGRPVQFTAVVKFHAEGDWKVQARARCVISPDATWGDLATIYLHVGRDTSHFGFDPVQMPPGPAEDVPEPPPVAPEPGG